MRSRKDPVREINLAQADGSPEPNSTDHLDRAPSLSIEDVDNELVQDWMTHNPVTIESSASVIDAYWLMVEHNIRRLPVIDNGILVGIITLNDLRSNMPVVAVNDKSMFLSETLSEVRVVQLMSSSPKMIGPTTRLVEAARMMLDNKISAIPVVYEEQVVGIITESDIFRVMVELCPV